MTPETPDPPPVSPDPWKDVDWTALKDRAGTLGVHAAINYVQAQVDAARAADAARHQQELQVVEMGYAGMKAAQDLASNVIADLRAAISTVDAQVHQQAELLAQRWDTIERLTKQHNEWKAQAEQHAALLRERDAQIASLELRVLWQVGEADELATLTGLVESWCQADAHDKPADSGWVKRLATVGRVNVLARKALAELATLRVERDAAQQERDRLKEQMQFFADAKPETWDDPADFRLWVQGRARYLLAPFASSPRPQEPQPAEPKSSETRKPVVNLMEALKKSLDSLNANRTSQEPGGHQP